MDGTAPATRLSRESDARGMHADARPRRPAPRKVRTGGNEDGCGGRPRGANGHRATTHTHAPREAATGSTYCKAIVANRKLPIGATRATGQRLGRQECAPGRLEADDPVALGVQLAAGNLQSNCKIARRSPQGFDYTRKMDFRAAVQNGPPTKPVKPASAPPRRRPRHHPRRRHPRRATPRPRRDRRSDAECHGPTRSRLQHTRRTRRRPRVRRIGCGIHYSGGMRSTCPG